MAFEYLVVSTDRTSDRMTDTIGYIGRVTTEYIIYPKQTINISGSLYTVHDIRRHDRGDDTLYVSKVQSVELETEEFEQDIKKKTLQEIFDFIDKHSIETIYYTGGVRLVFAHHIGCNKFTDLKVEGRDLSQAVLHIRHLMRRNDVIKRGEW